VGAVSANRSTAVMQRRRVAPDSLDYFPTPPFATRALCEFLEAQGIELSELVCWEPACGEGHMVRPLEEYFGDVIATDVHRYGDHHDLFDFTLCAMMGHGEEQPDFVITNPPFRLGEEFIAAASAVAKRGFAMLARSAFLEGGERYQRIWSTNPPSFVLQFCERVVMLEGRLVRRGATDPQAEDGGKAASATAYCWLVWLDGEPDSRIRWIAPCMERLERPGDYPDYAPEVLPPSADGLFGEGDSLMARPSAAGSDHVGHGSVPGTPTEARE